VSRVTRTDAADVGASHFSTAILSCLMASSIAQYRRSAFCA
jgi:hypothetical protein